MFSKNEAVQPGTLCAATQQHHNLSKRLLLFTSRYGLTARITESSAKNLVKT
jgi:hypothetical protein